MSGFFSFIVENCTFQDIAPEFKNHFLFSDQECGPLSRNAFIFKDNTFIFKISKKKLDKSFQAGFTISHNQEFKYELPIIFSGNKVYNLPQVKSFITFYSVKENVDIWVEDNFFENLVNQDQLTEEIIMVASTNNYLHLNNNMFTNSLMDSAIYCRDLYSIDASNNRILNVSSKPSTVNSFLTFDNIQHVFIEGIEVSNSAFK
mmetsp:Transcript_15118/g.14703  ORF Transcript_15118/g.14703 Transcript_15118/m.14703 type:complete len:203 (-) Transcript_15118:367-975(-)